MILRDNNILCGCEDGQMCIYDTQLNNINSENEKKSNNTISGLISINEHQFISSSYDNTIKVWEY